MSHPDNERVALVMGGSRGIGRAVAVALAAGGARVGVNYVANRAAADETVRAVEAAGGRGLAIQGDMARLEQIRATYDALEREFGPPDVVVLAPGAFVMKPIAEITEEEYDRVFALNTKGVFFALQEAARRVRSGGAIVSLSSGATASPGAGGSVYAASKAAAEHFTYALARELGPRDVSVNSVSPGLTQTDGLVLPPPVLAEMLKRIPFGRVGKPEEVAAVVAFLASPAGHWVTGQSVRANGGLV